ncbi:MAG: sugar phosphate isomerase/epimerase family protein [Planctomycetota bacterium]
MANTHPIDDALAQMKAAGFGALELAIATEGVLTIGSTEADCQAIRGQIDASGLHVSTVASGMSWGTNPLSDDPAVRELSNTQVEAALQRVAWLGCEAFLYVPGIVGCPFVPDEKVRYDHALARCRENLERLLPNCEKLGVDLCLENVWNGFLTSPIELRDFIDSLGSDRLGVYFDVGNCLGYHQHPPHWIELLGHRIKRVHVKDFKHDFDWQGSYDFCELGEGDVPWDETLAALRALPGGGYDKTVIAEMLPYKPGRLEPTAAFLKQWIDRFSDSSKPTPSIALSRTKIDLP